MRDGLVRILCGVLLLFSLQSVAPVYAQAGRVALVIGNGSYDRIDSLKNPTNDSGDMAATLKRLGFKVYPYANADRKTMRRAIDEFNGAIQGAEIALFYYAGHGVQLDGENYLVPVDAEVTVAGDVPDECIPLSRITARMDEDKAGTNIIILDACRNNPFMAMSRGMERGLAVIGKKPPESIILYATAENAAAEDGAGRNGIFTAALLENIEKRESFTDLMLDVRKQVATATDGRQKPAEYNSLTHKVYLAGEKKEQAQLSEPGPERQPAASGESTWGTVTVATGSMSLTVADRGTVLFQNVSKDLPAGSSVNIAGIAPGKYPIAITYADGKTETQNVDISAGRNSAVSFTYVAPAAKSGQSIQQGRHYVVGDLHFCYTASNDAYFWYSDGSFAVEIIGDSNGWWDLRSGGDENTIYSSDGSKEKTSFYDRPWESAAAPEAISDNRAFAITGKNDTIKFDIAGDAATISFTAGQETLSLPTNKPIVYMANKFGEKYAFPSEGPAKAKAQAKAPAGAKGPKPAAGLRSHIAFSVGLNSDLISYSAGETELSATGSGWDFHGQVPIAGGLSLAASVDCASFTYSSSTSSKSWDFSFANIAAGPGYAMKLGAFVPFIDVKAGFTLGSETGSYSWEGSGGCVGFDAGAYLDLGKWAALGLRYQYVSSSIEVEDYADTFVGVSSVFLSAGLRL